MQVNEILRNLELQHDADGVLKASVTNLAQSGFFDELEKAVQADFIQLALACQGVDGESKSRLQKALYSMVAQKQLLHELNQYKKGTN